MMYHLFSRADLLVAAFKECSEDEANSIRQNTTLAEACLLEQCQGETALSNSPSRSAMGDVPSSVLKHSLKQCFLNLAHLKAAYRTFNRQQALAFKEDLPKLLAFLPGHQPLVQAVPISHAKVIAAKQALNQLLASTRDVLLGAISEAPLVATSHHTEHSPSIAESSQLEPAADASQLAQLKARLAKLQQSSAADQTPAPATDLKATQQRLAAALNGQHNAYDEQAAGSVQSLPTAVNASAVNTSVVTASDVSQVAQRLKQYAG